MSTAGQIKASNFLQRRFELMGEITEVMHEIQGGASVASACNGHGLDYNRFNTFLNSKSFTHMRLDKPIAMVSDARLEPTSVEQLYNSLFGGGYNPPLDAVATVEHVLSTLTETEQDIIKGWYGIGCEAMNYSEIANVLGITRERVRQCFVKAEKKMRHPSRARILVRGLTVYRAEQEAEKRILEEKERAIAEACTRKIEAMREAVKDGLSKDSFEELCQRFRMYNIDSLGLSVRAYNALRRAGLNTVYDVLLVEDVELLRIRSLGAHTLDEINGNVNELLSRYGVDVDEIKFFLKEYNMAKVAEANAIATHIDAKFLKDGES